MALEAFRHELGAYGAIDNIDYEYYPLMQFEAPPPRLMCVWVEASKMIENPDSLLIARQHYYKFRIPASLVPESMHYQYDPGDMIEFVRQACNDETLHEWSQTDGDLM